MIASGHKGGWGRGGQTGSGLGLVLVVTVLLVSPTRAGHLVKVES